MPLPDRPRLCILGDSHLSAPKRALDAGHALGQRFEVELFGAPGSAFRKIDYVDGLFRCRDTETEEMVLKVNGQRRELPIDAFDALLIYGARLSSPRFFLPVLEALASPDHAMSAALLDLQVRRFLSSFRTITAARAIAALGRHRVYVAPTPLYAWTEDPAHRSAELIQRHPGARLAEPAHRDRARALLCDAAAAEGVTLLFQPEDTITEGAFTHARWQQHPGDPLHMNAEFAGRLFDLLLAEEDRAAGAADAA
ncbi:hypothetical protein [Litorisediminicola beolgyonensis]|uniref:SGNH/GDSL hydrolase family protein n=1 Tax=Litorisediminicola beolgyonensis TaxID=1173614 RepID=A0ABW3ZMJ2_9RHOB